MKHTLFVALTLISLTAFSQNDTTLIHFLNPNSVSTPKGYSHAVTVDLGNCKMVLISGQVALDKNGNLIDKGDLAMQTEQVFLNIKSIVEAAGGTMNDVVKLGIYMTDVKQIQTVRNMRDKYVNLKNPPASTLVEVSKLFRDDVLIEIEATAIISHSKK